MLCARCPRFVCVRALQPFVVAEVVGMSSIGGNDEEDAMTPPTIFALSELLPSPHATSVTPTTSIRCSTNSQTTASFPAGGITRGAMNPTDAALACLLGMATEALQSHRGVEERVSTLLQDLPADEGEAASAIIHVLDVFDESPSDEKIAAARCSEVRDLLTSVQQAIETEQELPEDKTMPLLADSTFSAAASDDTCSIRPAPESANSFTASGTTVPSSSMTDKRMEKEFTCPVTCRSINWSTGMSCSLPAIQGSCFCARCVDEIKSWT